MGTDTGGDARPFSVDAMEKNENRDADAGEVTFDRAVVVAGDDVGATAGDRNFVGVASCDEVSTCSAASAAALLRLMYQAPARAG